MKNLPNPVEAYYINLKNNHPGKRLRKLRAQKQISANELAERCNLNTRTIYDYETGKSIPKLKSLRRIAEALGLSIAYLCEFDKLPENSFPEKLKKARMYIGLHKNEFADLLGVNVRTVRQWEKGLNEPQKEMRAMLEDFILCVLDRKNLR